MRHGETLCDLPYPERSERTDFRAVYEYAGCISQILKRKGVSYIQAGEDSLDCGIALEKLFRLFGICKLLVCGGGMIDLSLIHI